MPNDNKSGWENNWQNNDIPFGEPFVDLAKPLVQPPSVIKDNAKQERVIAKNQKRAKRQATRNMINSRLLYVILGVAVVAVIVYKLVNGIDMVGPDVENLPDFRKL